MNFSISLFNLDLLAIGVTSAAVLLIGFIAFFTDRKSTTVRGFLLFSIATVAYSVTNYLTYQSFPDETILWLLRLTIFFALWHAFSFFRFVFSFPSATAKLRGVYGKALITGVTFISLLTLSPFVFSSLAKRGVGGGASTAILGPGILFFAIAAVALVLAGVGLLAYRTYKSEGKERLQFLLLLSGVFLTFAAIVYFNVVLPIAYENTKFVPYASIFFFPLVFLGGYALIRHGFMSVKIISTEILMFVLAITTLLQLIFANSLIEKVATLFIFVLVLVFGILLTKSVVRELKQREHIETLAKDLEKANDRLKELDKQKTEFVSIASHQLRAPLTAIKGYMSLLLEKSYGEIPPQMLDPLQKIAESSRLMVNSIEDFLNVSRIELGRMKFEMGDFDLIDLAKKVVEELRPVAERKGLQLSFSTGEQKCPVKADVGKIKQVITNFVDNAIKYSPQGSIAVSLTLDLKLGKARISIKDTGIGMSQQTISEMFEKFTRARNANSVNTTGTGLGLYVGKQLIEGHKGRVWAESEGEGKGSTFHIELPLQPA